MGRLGDFLIAVVQVGDDKRRHFQVASGRDGQHFYGVLYGCQVAADEVVEALGEALQVDVRGIDERCHLVQRAVVHVAVGYQHVDQATLVGEVPGVADELEAHERLVVGEGEPDVALGRKRCGRIHQLGRCDFAPGHVAFAGAGDGGVLAERAAQVAAVGTYGEHLASRAKAGQRLLLDGIQRQRRDAPVVGVHHLPALGDARTAEPRLPLGQRAGMRANRTHSVVCAKVAGLFP